MDPAAAKLIGAGLACSALIGAGIGIGVIFGNFLARRAPQSVCCAWPNSRTCSLGSRSPKQRVCSASLSL